MRVNWSADDIKPEDEDVSEGLKAGTWRLAGETREGHVIQQILVGKFIPDEVRSMEQYWRTIICQRELSVKTLAAKNWKTETTVVIFDSEPLSFFFSCAFGLRKIESY